jgi:hypothetical protein
MHPLLPPPPPLNPIPHLIEVLDAAVRSDLESLRFSYFVKLLVLTGFVFVGLGFEVGEILHDVIGYFRRRKIDWEYEATPAFIREKREPSHKIKMFAAVGWLLIVIGVGGEGYFEGFVSWADSTLQTFNNILLADAQRTSVVANERSSAAYERASENEKETAETLKQAQQERTDAAKSLEVTKGYESQIAEAQREAADSKKEAESERLERVKLQQQLAPRRLSGKQIDGLVTRFKPLAKRGQIFIVITFPAFNPEGDDFAKDFEAVFKAAEWKPTRTGWNQTGERGLDIGMLEDPAAPGQIPAAYLSLVQYIRDAMVAEGVPCRIFPLKPDAAVSLAKPEKSVLYLMVGHKPEPVMDQR